MPTKKFIEFYESAIKPTSGKQSGKGSTEKSTAKKKAPARRTSRKKAGR